ncbi:hypothetical protein K440DRAFT_658065 [Wilcoxina mikolae CBS 423.85]|nr:hypothetical protein K440DRAFT_658065 [Wilcoxina mikolae CBS 423.85]
MSFWNRMQLWEKMLFVCTVVFAVSKLTYRKRKEKWLIEQAEAKKKDLENIRKYHPFTEVKNDEVPFGSKALEAGIEVDGIVISRPVTPDTRSQQTLFGSENGSLESRGRTSPGLGVARGQQMPPYGRPQVYQPSPYIALPAPVHHGNSGSSSLRSSAASVVSTPSGSGSNDASLGVGRRTFSDPMLQYYAPVSPASRSGSSTPRSNAGNIADPVALTLARLEGRTLSPSLQSRENSYTHGSSHLSSRSQSRTPSPPEGQRTPTTLASVREDSVGESSRDSSMENDEIERPRRVGPASAYLSPVIPETAAGDLSLLQIHRLSHAAEVGQLFPRYSRRVLSDTDLINNPSPTPPLPLPTMVQPVYAFDINLQRTVPTAAVLREENLGPSLPERVHTKPYTEQSFQSGEASELVEEIVWDKPAEAQVAERKDVDEPSTDPKPEEKVRKVLNRLRKKRVSETTTGSMEVDLEAQV